MAELLLTKRPLISYLSLSALAVATALTSGCANMPLDMSSRADRIGVDDGSDPCRTHVVALDSTGDFFAGDMLKGALIGAASGALAGGAAATMAGKDPMAGLLVGAMVGGVAGAGFSYWNQLAQQGKDQAILKVDKDMDENITSAEKAQLALDKLLTCRKQQRDVIRADYKKGALSKDAAQAKWSQWGVAVKRDLALAETVSKNLGERLNSFNYAAEQANTPVDISKMTPQEKAQYDADLKNALSAMATQEETERRLAKEAQAAKKRQLADEYKLKEAAAKKSKDKAAAAALANEKKNALSAVDTTSKAEQDMIKAKYSDTKEAAKKNPKGSILLTKKHALVKREGEVKAQVGELGMMAKQSEGGFEDATTMLPWGLPSLIAYSAQWLDVPPYGRMSCAA